MTDLPVSIAKEPLPQRMAALSGKCHFLIAWTVHYFYLAYHFAVSFLYSDALRMCIQHLGGVHADIQLILFATFVQGAG